MWTHLGIVVAVWENSSSLSSWELLKSSWCSITNQVVATQANSPFPLNSSIQCTHGDWRVIYTRGSMCRSRSNLFYFGKYEMGKITMEHMAPFWKPPEWCCSCSLLLLPILTGCSFVHAYNHDLWMQFPSFLQTWLTISQACISKKSVHCFAHAHVNNPWEFLVWQSLAHLVVPLSMEDQHYVDWIFFMSGISWTPTLHRSSSFRVVRSHNPRQMVKFTQS